MINKNNKSFDMEDLLYALNYAAKNCALGIKGIADKTGQREQTLRNKLTPGDVSHQVSLGDFVLVMMQADDTSPLDTLCNMFSGQFISRTNQACDTIMLAVLKAMSEHGDIADALNKAMEDDVIDARELSLIHREIIEGRNALTRLENTVNAYRNHRSGVHDAV